MTKQIFVFLLAFFSGIHIDFACCFHGLGAKYALAEHYAANNQYEIAFQKLNEVSTQEGFEAMEHSRYIAIFTLRKNVYQSGRTLAALTEAEKDSLQNIRSISDKGSSVLANNILCFWQNDCQEFGLPIPFDNSSQQLRTNKPTHLAGLFNQITVSPNPAKGFTVFEYEIVNTEKAVLQIYDAVGKCVKTFPLANTQGNVIWDTHSHANGLYIYELSLNGQKVSTGKIIVNNN